MEGKEANRQLHSIARNSPENPIAGSQRRRRGALRIECIRQFVIVLEAHTAPCSERAV